MWNNRGRGGFLSTYTNPQTYRNLMYLFLTFPLGLFYFVFLITGFSVGLGLAFIIIGFPILLFMLAAVRGLAAFERRMAVSLLDAEIEPTHSSSRPGQSIVKRYFNFATIKETMYLFAKFPLGLGTFVAGVTAFSMIFALILAPFYYNSASLALEGPNFMVTHISSLPAALAASAFGFVLAFIALPVFNFLAELWRDFSVMMLEERRSPYDERYDRSYDYDYDYDEDYFEKPKRASTRGGRLVEVPAGYDDLDEVPRKPKRLPTLQEQIDAALADESLDDQIYDDEPESDEGSTTTLLPTLEERIRAALQKNDDASRSPSAS